MSERARIPGKPASDDPASQAHRAEIAARLRDIVSYPLGVKTRVPNLPGAIYNKPWPNDPNQQPYALLGDPMRISVLDTGGASDISGDHMELTVRPRQHEGHFRLDLSQIEGVFVDLPRGSSMPVHGSAVLPVGLTRNHGISILRWPSGIIEQDTHDRVEVTEHTHYPGITVASFYNADGATLEDGSRERLSLSAAKERAQATNALTRLVLLSHIEGSAVYIATSQLGYQEQSSVTVRKPRRSDEHRHVEMVDFPMEASANELLESHLHRHEEWAGILHGSANFPDRPQRQPDIDSTLTYMWHD